LGGEEWILEEHHRHASLPTEQTKRFLQILKKKKKKKKKIEAANHCSKKKCHGMKSTERQK
jgi:uncharacterized protein (DUF1778 family)